MIISFSSSLVVEHTIHTLYEYRKQPIQLLPENYDLNRVEFTKP